MSISFCRAKAISRTSKRSAVAAAAYRSGEKLHDDENGKEWSYKKDEIVYSKITLPENAPKEFADRETLWNSVQKAEKQANARVARELVIAFPNELSQEQAQQVIEDFSEYLAKKGMCVDAAIHWKNGNHHAHLMLTTRKIDKNGHWAEWKERKEYARDESGNKIPLLDKNGKQKTRERQGKGVEKLWKRVSVLADEWSKKTEYNKWKKELAGMMNAELEKIGVSDKVDYRSYKERGIDKVPQVHEGYVARAIEKRGGKSFLCEHNREIRALNAKIEQTQKIEKRIAELKKQKEQQQKAQQEKIYPNWDAAVADNPKIKNQQMYVANVAFKTALEMKNYKLPPDHINRKMIDATLKETQIKVKDNIAIPNITIPALPAVFNAMMDEYKIPNKANSIAFAEISAAIKSAVLNKDYDKVFSLIEKMQTMANEIGR